MSITDAIVSWKASVPHTCQIDSIENKCSKAEKYWENQKQLIESAMRSAASRHAPSVSFSIEPRFMYSEAAMKVLENLRHHGIKFDILEDEGQYLFCLILM